MAIQTSDTAIRNASRSPTAMVPAEDHGAEQQDELGLKTKPVAGPGTTTARPSVVAFGDCRSRRSTRGDRA